MTALFSRFDTTNITGLRQTVARGLIGLALLHVPALSLVAWWRDENVALIGAVALVLALLPALLMQAGRPTLVVGAALAVALVGQTSLLVFVMRGHPWQIEMHFYYFAVLAMLGGFCGWRLIVLAAALIALEHAVFDLLLPAAIFPGGTDIGRFLVHAWVVVVESAVLILIGGVIRRAFEALEQTRARAEASAAELERLATARAAMLSTTTEHAEQIRALLEQFKAEMAQSIDLLHESAIDLTDNANSLGVASTKTGAQVVAVSAASEATARKVELMAAAGQELSHTIGEVGVSAERSATLAAAAVEEAGRTTTTMDEMAAVSAEIGDVTGLISGIAEQTNLLALNATIEAARAGEAGRGFSVVAQEVKALASQTAKATQDIARRVAAMQDTSNRSVAAIHAVSEKIRALEDVSTGIAAAVNQQAMATSEIAQNVDAAANSVGHVEKSIARIEELSTGNAQAVAHVSAAAQAVAEQTRAIRERVRSFTEDVARLRA
jgi:methyl-accepting chemotaxis protein